MQRFLFFIFFATCLLIHSCTYDKVPQEDLDCGGEIVTYESGPQAIMIKSCSYSGCHVTGFSSGDFSSYSGMKSRLDNGAFEEWVIEDRRMPPADAPDGKPKFLTEDEILVLKCWVDGGYLEN